MRCRSKIILMHSCVGDGSCQRTRLVDSTRWIDVLEGEVLVRTNRDFVDDETVHDWIRQSIPENPIVELMNQLCRDIQNGNLQLGRTMSE